MSERELSLGPEAAILLCMMASTIAAGKRLYFIDTRAAAECVEFALQIMYEVDKHVVPERRSALDD